MPEKEKHLIKECLTGNRTAQAKLYNLFAPKMLGICMWYAGNKQEAEEILQDGFMRVFTYLHKYSGKGSFEGWMRKIMVNCALNKYKNKSHLRLVIEYHADLPDVEENNSFLKLLDAKELVKLVQTLSPGYRIVFNLYVMEGMKHREIAEALGISEGTSKSNLADAKRILRRAFIMENKIASI